MIQSSVSNGGQFAFETNQLPFCADENTALITQQISQLLRSMGHEDEKESCQAANQFLEESQSTPSSPLLNGWHLLPPENDHDNDLDHIFDLVLRDRFRADTPPGLVSKEPFSLTPVASPMMLRSASDQFLNSHLHQQPTLPAWPISTAVQPPPALFTVPGQLSRMSSSASQLLPILPPEALAPLHVVLPINLPYGSIIVEPKPSPGGGCLFGPSRLSRSDVNNTQHSSHHYYFKRQYPSSNNLFSRLHGFCNQSPSWLALDIGYIACREHQVAPVVDAFNAFFEDAFRKLAATRLTGPASESTTPAIPLGTVSPWAANCFDRKMPLDLQFAHQGGARTPSSLKAAGSLSRPLSRQTSSTSTGLGGESTASTGASLSLSQLLQKTQEDLFSCPGLSSTIESPRSVRTASGHLESTGTPRNNQEARGIPPIKLRCSGIRLRDDHGSGWYLYETPVEACSDQDIWYFKQILKLIEIFHSQLKEARLCQHATMKPFTNDQVAIVILKQEGSGVAESELQRMNHFCCEGIEVSEIRLVRHKLQDKFGHTMFERDPRFSSEAEIYSRAIAHNSVRRHARVVFAKAALPKVILSRYQGVRANMEELEDPDLHLKLTSILSNGTESVSHT